MKREEAAPVMLDAVVIAKNPDALAVARSLGSLVEGIVPGMLARVCVLAPAATSALSRLCDESGADLVTATENRAALDRLAAGHLLVLPQGKMMPAGWARLLEEEWAAGGALGPTEGMAIAGRMERLRARFAAGLKRPDPFMIGGIVPMRLARSCDFGRERPRMAMPLRTSRLIRLQQG